MIKTRTQDMASAAYRCVAKRREDLRREEMHREEMHREEMKPSQWDAYCALAHRFPSMILENGLAQATGFLLAKGREEHRALLDDLHQVLRNIKATRASDPEALHQEIIDSDLRSIMLLTRRTLDATGWVKRYVQGAASATAADHENSRGSTP